MWLDGFFIEKKFKEKKTFFFEFFKKKGHEKKKISKKIKIVRKIDKPFFEQVWHLEEAFETNFDEKWIGLHD